MTSFAYANRDDWIDEEAEDAEAEYWEDYRREQYGPCSCKLCVCVQETEYGGVCYDCAHHAHQG